ncbi:molybdenum cofactor guanylyltransferase [Sphingosinicella rhizophila]|uniref:Molybdenum cofactor guanylyltransferase n=1 Tax=Sphingosinicella rhizophila TaxID=3050082 RepID=A0ABU3Q5U7_9SPHN|nr:molybdenum cofactor guanylyltransferase [Sphingosinicella sp. GR2756]MDT9598786.1 molybdenum cofactor guanylyltransferase [Sphingosinicella sp. GR2756]
MRIGAVILAGGAGRRIGGDKPFRLLAGRSLVDHVLDQVKAWQIPCAIAIRDHADLRFPDHLPLLHDREDAGPIAGLASALRHAVREGLDAILTLPCDTPLLPRDLPERLKHALALPSEAAVARSGERLHPSCGLWRASASVRIENYLQRRASLRGFAEELGAVIVAWPVQPYDPFFNVNTEDDLAAAENLLKGR